MPNEKHVHYAGPPSNHISNEQTGRWFETRRRHCVVSLSKSLYSLLSTGLFQEDSD